MCSLSLCFFLFLFFFCDCSDWVSSFSVLCEAEDGPDCVGVKTVPLVTEKAKPLLSGASPMCVVVEAENLLNCDWGGVFLLYSELSEYQVSFSNGLPPISTQVRGERAWLSCALSARARARVCVCERVCE